MLLRRRQAILAAVAGGRGGGGVQTYIEQVLSVAPANLLGFWPLTETSGTIADNAEGNAARDGTYSNVSLNQISDPFGELTAGLWLPANTPLCNIYSANYAGVFTPQEFTMLLWLNWIDTTNTYFVNYRVDSSNAIQCRLSSGTNCVISYTAGGVVKSVSTTLTANAWTEILLRVSLSNDRMRVRKNNVQQGTTQTGIGTWAGSLTTTQTTLGAFNTSGSNPIHGYLAYHAVWNKELSDAEADAVWRAPNP